LIVAVAALLILSACGGSAGPADGEVLVSAAASLTEAFGALETAFEATHPGVDVVLNLGGSSALREQILAGAPADVFASANVANMERVDGAGAVVGAPEIFAANHLEIAVPPGNPAGVTGLDDFARGDLLIGLCAPGVPCGDYGREALAGAGVEPSIDTEEPNVRALLTKIEAGELDAGIVYVTDVVAAGGTVDGIEIPDDVNVFAEYPIAVLSDAPNPIGATAFTTFVLSDRGGKILSDYGFDLP
jgi:molybdate transport system substrate-binding protein